MPNTISVRVPLDLDCSECLFRRREAVYREMKEFHYCLFTRRWNSNLYLSEEENMEKAKIIDGKPTKFCREYQKAKIDPLEVTYY